MANVTVTEFLSWKATEPVVLGSDDCLLWLADLAMALRGVADPAAHLRGTYSTPLQAARVIRRAGGPVALIASVLEPVGAQRVEEPVSGDVGVIMARGLHAETPIGAIRTGGMWTFRSRRGLMGVRADALAAWRL